MGEFDFIENATTESLRKIHEDQERYLREWLDTNRVSLVDFRENFVVEEGPLEFDTKEGFDSNTYTIRQEMRVRPRRDDDPPPPPMPIHWVDLRDPECVKVWPDCYTFVYDPRCCRFPKSCSAGSFKEVPIDDESTGPNTDD